MDRTMPKLAGILIDETLYLVTEMDHDGERCEACDLRRMCGKTNPDAENSDLALSIDDLCGWNTRPDQIFLSEKKIDEKLQWLTIPQLNPQKE